MAMKMGRPCQTTGSPARINGENSRKRSVNEGTLIAAPDSSSTVRNPNCAVTTPAPKKVAEAKASRMAAVMMSVLRAGLMAVFVARRLRLANPLAAF